MSKHDDNTDSNVDKAVTKPAKKAKKGFLFAIMGIGMLLVIVSITYSTVVIVLGTDGLMPKIMLAPQALFGVLVLGFASTKIFK